MPQPTPDLTPWIFATREKYLAPNSITNYYLFMISSQVWWLKGNIFLGVKICTCEKVKISRISRISRISHHFQRWSLWVLLATLTRTTSIHTPPLGLHDSHLISQPCRPACWACSLMVIRVVSHASAHPRLDTMNFCHQGKIFSPQFHY